MDYAALTNALYDKLGRWELVAVECGDEKKKRGYYWNIAHGSKPNRYIKRAILEAAKRHIPLSIALTRSPRDFARKNVSYSTDLYQKMLALKNSKNETWQQFGENALKARLRMEEE